MGRFTFIRRGGNIMGALSVSFQKELKQRFIQDLEEKLADGARFHNLVVAVKLPSGAIEIIINSNELVSKARYYDSAYDEFFQLKSNPTIRIVNFMIV